MTVLLCVACLLKQYLERIEYMYTKHKFAFCPVKITGDHFVKLSAALPGFLEVLPFPAEYTSLPLLPTLHCVLLGLHIFKGL